MEIRKDIWGRIELWSSSRISGKWMKSSNLAAAQNLLYSSSILLKNSRVIRKLFQKELF